jgi:hypothetical protein
MSLYKKFMSIREEIMKHKWIESEKKQQDIGFEPALIDWVKKHSEETKKNLESN